MVSRRLIAAVLAGAVTFGGCTGMKTIRPAVRPANPGDPTFGPVQSGDTVFVHTRDGEQVCFVVQHIDGETLIATGGRRYARYRSGAHRPQRGEPWKDRGADRGDRRRRVPGCRGDGRDLARQEHGVKPRFPIFSLT